MEEKKGIKISLGTAICMCIILILIFVIIALYYFGFVDNKNKKEQTNSDTKINVSNENDNNVNKPTKPTNPNDKEPDITELEPTTYVIKFDANLLGEKYDESDYQMEEESYSIEFLENNEVQFILGWGFYMKGTYTISNNDKINCKLTSCGSDNSPEQKVNIKISLKINSKSEIEIIDIPEKYTIRISELGDSGWELTDETKTMEFWPFVEGIKFVSSTY